MRPLAAAEVTRYLAFRMRAAGYRGPDVFAQRAAHRIARASDGLTRRINILADKSLLAAYSEGAHAITERHAKAAIADSEFAAAATRRARRPLWLAAAGLGLGLVLGALIQWLLASAEIPAVQALVAPPAKRAPAATDPLEAELDIEDQLAAIAEVPTPSVSDGLLSPGQRSRLEAYATGGYKLLSERLEATRELLDSAPDERYALELFVTDNPQAARMERFLLRARDLVPISEVFLIPMAGPRSPRLRVIYGTFQSEREARAALTRLPPKYQQSFRVAPRRFGELREQM
jgi:hypothetical protein